MQRRHSSNTDGMPSERSRSQTVESESSLDEGGVFDCLKPDSPTSPQQIFSGLVGVPSGAVSSAQFQAASLVLGSHPDVFIQMTTLSREEGGPRRPEQAAAATSERHHHGPREEVGQEDPSAPAPALSELKAVVSWLQRGFPFILILLAKVCFQHKLGIAVCVGLASTFTYANATFKHQVSLREERSVLMALWLALFLSGNVAYIYYAFRQEELHKSLMFSKPNLNGFDFFDLMWAVGINDFVLKFVTVGLKCFVLLLPGIFLAFKSRGKFYLLIEELSQLFRALVPIQLWYKYIMGEEPSASYFLGAALIIIYSLCKGKPALLQTCCNARYEILHASVFAVKAKSFDICGRASSLRKALVLLCHSQSYGMRAGSQQCSDAGDICAICQADFREPVVLLCQHVFCEDCLSSWLDRERVCPLCRANVVETLRCWKDGTTSAHFQIY
ncbi:RING finger and transmembrane domain-containing protein 2 isoform X3 [Corythoichthys intestinalis]|uniref:RING finger and transmembrane domain-containing protein 2 isoform X3 n=1 Tax=Corythoichthys intestinalis TaxID=161448 RepID=UPI0025A4E858|nr:RING finger and transmembrane domain-containing protein 2 isoform X3 [Corythoichthys intestinalis]